MKKENTDDSEPDVESEEEKPDQEGYGEDFRCLTVMTKIQKEFSS